MTWERRSRQLEAQLSEKNRAITAKRQLQTMFNELKKQKGQKSSEQFTVSLCTTATPSSIPNQKSIKVRYKQLSKIYHPDGQDVTKK
ncbi:hypothetical protein OK016_01455 [Vibrio chagasii]|nr:hypothetical protein [Vibrio chagasii]